MPLGKDFIRRPGLAINTVGWLAARPAYPVTPITVPPGPDCQSRALIHAAAAKVCSRGRKGSCDLVGADF